jgi:hypothetical protein
MCNAKKKVGKKNPAFKISGRGFKLRIFSNGTTFRK